MVIQVYFPAKNSSAKYFRNPETERKKVRETIVGRPSNLTTHPLYIFGPLSLPPLCAPISSLANLKRE